jgi:lysine-N-methylase
VATTARYMARFQCRGSDCEDTCCQEWRVPVDRQRYHVLQQAMDGSPDERREFQAAVVRDERTGASPDQHAHIRLDACGQCPFLTEARLCSVQARYGPQVMPAVCASYPRLVVEVGGRTEIWGGLSCPEVARQCLLHEDALEIVELPAGPWTPARVVPTAAPAPYERHLGRVRAAAHHLLTLRDLPVGGRLFLLAYLGRETARFFHRGARAVDEEALARTIADVTLPATVALWKRELAAMPAPRALTANLVNQLMAAQADIASVPFRQLVAATVDSYRAGGALDERGAVVPAALWRDYAARRQRWEETAPGRVDRYFENYARSFWLREPYTTSIDLLAHTRRLLVRVAVLRLLLFGHPALADAAAGREALDRAAVEVFYKLSRAVEHQRTFLDSIAATVVPQGAQTFAHSTFLALV